jgi:hypothetical protein
MKRERINLALLGIWSLLLILLLVLHPKTNTALFWLLMIPTFIAGSAYMILDRRDNKAAQDEYKNWAVQIRTLVDENDVKDDGHLFEQFDADEWKNIFAALGRMPQGSKSLRKAITEIDPDFFK